MTPDEIADRLETVVADLDEMAFDLLREAMADGATTRPAADKQLARARRSVEKAAVILRQIDRDGDATND